MAAGAPHGSHTADHSRTSSMSLRKSCKSARASCCWAAGLGASTTTAGVSLGAPFVSGLAGWAGFEGAGLSPCFTNSAVIRATRHRAGLKTPTDVRLGAVRRPVACFVSWDVSCIFCVSSRWSIWCLSFGTVCSYAFHLGINTVDAS